ncbi:MgtC/SapB family protein [Propionibacteriaceae bacterium Y1685]|uniref:MgtC/SapB family protein n=1 Tax=Microlunatus sp. Y1700 TaxID=3418487 RepID=UPI003B7FCE8F
MALAWWTESTGTQLLLLGLALICSSIIGLERQFRQKNAGLRTHVLVALGSATFTLVSAFGFYEVLGTDVTLDPSRIAAQVVSGIGFLGAGVIFTRRDAVRGLTTAASIWVAAAVGMACGAGMPILAIALTVAHLLVVGLLAPLSHKIPTQYSGNRLVITYVDGHGVLRDVLETLAALGTSVSLISTHTTELEGVASVRVVLSTRGGPPPSDQVYALKETPGVRSVTDESAKERDNEENY